MTTPLQKPRTGAHWLGYIPQLFLVTILPLTLLLLAIAFGSVALHQKTMRDMAGQQDLRAVLATAQTLTSELNSRRDQLDASASLLADGIRPELVLAASSSTTFDGGTAFLQDGRLTISPAGGLFAHLSGEDLAALISSLPVEASPGVHAVDWPHALVTDPQDGTLYVVVARQAGTDARAAGAFAARSLAAASLTGITSGHLHSADMSIELVSPEGLTIYTMGTPPSQQVGITEAMRGESGVTYLRQAGQEVVLAFTPVEPLGWALVTREPWQAMADPMLKTTQLLPLVLVPALLLALVGLWFGARQVIQPLQVLKERAGQLSRGRYSPIQEPVGGIPEIQSLQAALVEMSRKVQASQDNMRSYLGAVTTGQEEERRRLAREIHDDTLQAVIALNQRVQLARQNLPDPVASASLAETQRLVENTIQNLRRLTRALRPAYLEELGLAASLEMLAKESTGDHVAVSFICMGEERRLPDQYDLALYRMAQEALNNVVKHAGAQQARLELTYEPASVQIDVQDDGRGFSVPENPGEFARLGHFGLLGLHERADLIGARLMIASAPGQGTRLSIHLPQPPA